MVDTVGGYELPPTPISGRTSLDNSDWPPSSAVLDKHGWTPSSSPPKESLEKSLLQTPGWRPPSPAPTKSQDVAIVGMSCRTAGNNTTPSQLWDFLLSKKHASGTVPPSRWEPWLRRDPRNAKILAATTPKGYFLDNLSHFDAAFFGISPKEAELMDPHQRLALELAWEALENSGIDPKKLAGSDTAVFMGVDSDDYSRLVMEDLPNIEAWSGIGTAYHGIPNRVSYHLDLMGPSTAVDAACASSLIAIHLGRQAILAGESKVALCGGVNVLCSPGLTYMLDKAGALASDGMCISFDDAAHGYARGEGGAIVVLKDLATAIGDNDDILAVLKGTATAQDGKTNGIMAPNAKAQEMVARQALLRSGGIDALSIGYVEAHATSTSLGDPTEVGAISNVYGVGRASDKPCAIGSIKPNVGHLEAAAGAIGFVKAVLAVNKGQLPPQTLLKNLNTKVDWKNSGLKVVQESSAWSETWGPRRAAVCSYGYGGSVAHAIIEQAPIPRQHAHTTGGYTSAVHLYEGPTEIPSTVSPVTLVLSSFQNKRIAAQATQLATYLSSPKTGALQPLASIAHTLSLRRAAQDYRVAITATTHAEAIMALQKFAAGSSSRWVTSNRVLGSDTSKDVVWVFSGHGAQWSGMASDLLHVPAFHDVIARLDGVVSREAGFSALEALREGDVASTSRVQILTYLMQIGLAAVLRSKGLRPQSIVGHSVGEIAAAVVAGCLSAEEGAVLISRRAKLLARVEGRGAMALVNLPFAEIKSELGERRDVVAAISSSPSACVVSGATAAVETYLGELAARGVKTFRVKTDIAFHSPMLDTLVKPFVSELTGALNPRPASVPVYSTSQATPKTEALKDVDYWVRNMVQPVWFNEAISAAVDDGNRLFLEVSSHPIITHSINEALIARGLDEATAIGTMQRDVDANRSILHAAAQLHTLGATVDFETQIGTKDWATDIPGTPWVHKSYWKTVETGTVSTTQQHDVDDHTLLGQCVDVAGSDTRLYSTTLDAGTKPYPLSHPLDDTEIIPAAVYCNTFQHATGATVLENIQLRVPTPITKDPRDVQVVVQGDSVRLSTRLASKPSLDQTSTSSSLASQHPWTTHSSSQWNISDTTSLAKVRSISALKSRLSTALPKDFGWTFLQKIGVQGIAYPWTVLEHLTNKSSTSPSSVSSSSSPTSPSPSQEEMLVHLDMDPSQSSLPWSPTSWAPLIDAATSIGSSIFHDRPKMRIVSGINSVSFVSTAPPPKTGYLLIRESSNADGLAADIEVLAESGEALVLVRGLRFSDVEAESEESGGVQELVHRLAWVPAVFGEVAVKMREVVVVCEDQEAAEVYVNGVSKCAEKVVWKRSVNELEDLDAADMLSKDGVIVVYVPVSAEARKIAQTAHAVTWEATRLVKKLAEARTKARLFIITNGVYKAATSTALAHAPLYGFARIAAQEHPEIWGGLIDNEDARFPALAIKYVQGADVIRMEDGLPRTAMMRPFTEAQRHPAGQNKTLLPKPHGTYLVTGGFGDLGLEVLDFLVAKGARRIVVTSRTGLPSRSTWSMTSDPRMQRTIAKIHELESKGATVHALALDIGAMDSSAALLAALEPLNLPPVLGVLHLAGASEDALIKNTTSPSYARVFAPKVSGTLNLHSAFPPATLDFFILFSSIGQLVGTPGQAPYGAANAFLDALATHRRAAGDNALAIQWTAWRGMGLAADADFLAEELATKGVSDVRRDEAFAAWEFLANFNTNHAVVARARILDANEPMPLPMLAEIARRRETPCVASSTTSSSDASTAQNSGRPLSGAELKTWLSEKIRGCIGTVLHMEAEEIDPRAAVADLGVDSVMSVVVRRELARVLGVKVPPTLMWKEPTVGHLVEWFAGEMAGGK